MARGHGGLEQSQRGHPRRKARGNKKKARRGEAPGGRRVRGSHLGEDEFRAAVEPPGGFVVSKGHRAFFAVAAGLDAQAVDAGGDQRGADGEGAAFAQRDIVFGAAAFVTGAS